MLGRMWQKDHRELIVTSNHLLSLSKRQEGNIVTYLYQSHHGHKLCHSRQRLLILSISIWSPGCCHSCLDCNGHLTNLEISVLPFLNLFSKKLVLSFRTQIQSLCFKNSSCICRLLLSLGQSVVKGSLCCLGSSGLMVRSPWGLSHLVM